MAVSIRNCLGIDIGSHTIRVAQIELGKTGPRITALLEEPLKLEAGLNEAQRQQQIARQLQHLLRSGRVRTRNAVFCVPGQSVFVRRIKLPKATPERMRGMIRFEARQQIPFPLDKTIMEYQIFETPESSEADVLLVAVKRDYILNFMKLVRRTGLRAVGISVSSLALYNFHELNNSMRPLASKPAKPAAPAKKDKKKGAEQAAEIEEEAAVLTEPGFEEIQAYVNIGASLMDLAIPRPGTERMIGFTRSVPLAGNEMDRVIREKLNLQSGEEATRIKEKETVVLATDFEIAGEDESVNVAASEAVTAVADRLISELRRSLDFFISQPDGVAVDSLVLSGGLAQLRYLSNYVEEKMGLPVEMAQLKNSQVRLPDNFGGAFAPYTIAAGLAFQGLGLVQNKIDFLPEEVKSVRGLRERMYEVAGMMAMLLLVIGMSLNVGSNYVSRYMYEVGEYENKIKEVQANDAALKAAEDLDGKVKEAYDKLAKSVGFRDYWLKFMKAVEEQRPPEVLIDKLDLRTDGFVVISGRAQKMAPVNQFVEGLKTIKGQNNEPTVLDATITLAGDRPRADARFGQPVYTWELRVKTFIRGPRIRTIGDHPWNREQYNQFVQAEAAMRGGGFGMGMAPRF